MVDIENAVIVAAHPDDEILWFSSIFSQCKKVIVCFGPSSNSSQRWDPGRAALITNYPHTKVKFLNIRQSDSLLKANWRDPTESSDGLQLRRPNVLYSNNTKKLLDLLEGELQGDNVVFTHNPWGEYGNEEHVQVFRILSTLRRSVGFDLLVNSYVSNRSLPLMSKSTPLLAGDALLLPTNTVIAGEMKELYLRYDCWTWMDDYEWPSYEIFYHASDRNPPDFHSKTTASLPMNYINGYVYRNTLMRFASENIPSDLRMLLKRALPNRRY